MGRGQRPLAKASAVAARGQVAPAGEDVWEFAPANARTSPPQRALYPQSLLLSATEHEGWTIGDTSYERARPYAFHHNGWADNPSRSPEPRPATAYDLAAFTRDRLRTDSLNVGAAPQHRLSYLGRDGRIYTLTSAQDTLPSRYVALLADAPAWTLASTSEEGVSYTFASRGRAMTRRHIGRYEWNLCPLGSERRGESAHERLVGQLGVRRQMAYARALAREFGEDWSAEDGEW